MKHEKILKFDRKAHCDFCGRYDYVAVCQYGTSHYNRLVCPDCVERITLYHKNMFGDKPCWFRNLDNEEE